MGSSPSSSYPFSCRLDSYLKLAHIHIFLVGYYVPTCQQTRYKGDYTSSLLLDPQKYTWHPLRDAFFTHRDEPPDGEDVLLQRELLDTAEDEE